MKKYFSMTLFLAIAMSMLSFCILAGNAAAEEVKIADPSTMTQYRTYFNANSTEYAGLVWTDKSVFTDADALKAGMGIQKDGKAVLPSVQCKNHQSHKEIALTPEQADQNFLVALSASASNKSIDGYGKRPTDTIFVLDISGSMQNTENKRIDQLVPAVNLAIEKLMKNNNNNRVGVVVYAAGVVQPDKVNKSRRLDVLLPLGRYETDATTTIQVEGKNENNENVTESVEVSEYIQTYPVTGDYERKIRIAEDKDGNVLVKEENGSLLNEKDLIVDGGTYTQGGLYTAWTEFGKQTEIKAEIEVKDELQSTIRRIPTLVLVTDGNPTEVTTNYTFQDITPDFSLTDANETVLGNGDDGKTTMDMAFLTQLTAIWVKEKMGNHYNEINLNESTANVADPVTPLFYTLGIQTQDRNPARAVLNPAVVNTAEFLDEDKAKIKQLWTDYEQLNGDKTLNIKTNDEDETGSVTKVDGITEHNKFSPDQNYVDGAFEVTDGTEKEYLDVFNAIVAAIELQSRYTPTMVQTGDGYHDGYVTFIDDIGEHMEIKDVKGIAYGDKLFTGEHIAQLLTAETLGDLTADDKGSESGHRLIDAIATRLGLSTELRSPQRAQAIGLISGAYQDRLLGPATQDHLLREGVTVGNSFGWFANEDGEFIGKAEAGASASYEKPAAYWNWLDNNPPKIEGAAYKVRSYIFYDEIKPDTRESTYGDEISQDNTVYMSVQVREHIQSGKVSLIWRIPSRLIPLNEYTVYLEEGNSKLESIELNKKPLPVSLIYEIGPKEGYRSHEIEETMSSLKQAGTHTEANLSEIESGAATDLNHIVTTKDSDGNVDYYLYTNAVDKDPKVKPGHVSQHVNTVSYFKPSNQNERYRFSAPTLLYELKDGQTEPGENGENLKVAERGKDTLPEGRYWYKQYVFKQNGSKDIKQICHEVPQAILKPDKSHQSGAAGHSHVEKIDGKWHITVNTVEFPHNPIIEKKKGNLANPANPTNTLEHFTRAVLEIVDTDDNEGYPHDGIAEGDYIISSVLGNNGRLKVRADTGIALLKEVTNGPTDDQTFRFTIIRTDEKETGSRPCKVIRKTADGTETIHETEYAFNNGVLEIPDVKAGELVRVLGLHQGEVYTINEGMGFGHKLDKITVQQDPMSKPVEVPLAENIKITAGSQVHVTFTNKVGDFGMLALKKIVSHNYRYGFDIPMDKEFLFQLTFEKGEKGANLYANDVLYDMDGNAYVLDAKGVTKDNVKLKPNQVIVFTGLAQDTKVTVKEIIGPHEGYEIEEITGPKEGFVISADKTAEVTIGQKSIGEKKAASVTVHNLYKEPYVPQTGDNSRLILWTALLGLCAAGALLLKKRREH